MLAHSTTLAGLVGSIIGLINAIIPVLVTLVVLLFMVIGFQYARAGADAKGRGNQREALMWGLIALFVLFSVWGILRILCTSLLNSSSCYNGNTNTTLYLGPK